MPIKDSLKAKIKRNNKNVRQKKEKENTLEKGISNKIPFVLFCFQF